MRDRKQAMPIDKDRIRRISGTFSWIDHRFVARKWIDLLDAAEIYLYFWLIAVGDRNGVSFYSNEKTAALLKTPVATIQKARDGLIRKRFIAYRNGIAQVLALPDADRGDIDA